MLEILIKIWLTAVVMTIPLIWVEDALKPRNALYMWIASILVVGLDIGLIFVIVIMKIWGLE